MTDSTTTPAPAPSPELFDKETLLALFPGVLPVDAPASMTTALTTMLTSCIDAANTAGLAGVTPLLAKIVLDTMSLICTNAAMWLVNDYNAAIAGQPPTAPVVATPPSPVPPSAPNPAADLVYPAGQPALLHGKATLTAPWFTVNGGDADRVEIDLGPLGYPFTFGVIWMPTVNIAQVEGVLATLESDDGYAASLLVLNNGALMTQVRDVSHAMPIYGQAQLPDSVDYTQFLLSASIIVSDTERYTYSSNAGMSAADTSPAHFNAAAKVTLSMGNNSEGSQPFTGMIGYPFVVWAVLTETQLKTISADPTAITSL